MAAQYPTGNASNESKGYLLEMVRSSRNRGGFGDRIISNLEILEVSVKPQQEDPKRLEGRLVCRLPVDREMLNAVDTVHGGCSAWLIDTCTSMALSMLAAESTGSPAAISGVSQSLNVVYHSPASQGDVLRIVSITVALGQRATSARTEIWNETHHRLVASGTHVKMQASQPKAKI